VAPARGDQPATRQAGPAGPLLRPPGTGQPARRWPGATRPGTRPPGTPQPGAVPAAGCALPAAAAHVPRTRFVLLLLGLLGGGLVCLLVINTTLAAASFRISALQQGNVALARQEQTLQQQVTTEESPASLERRARKLGLRPQPRMNFINLRTGRVYRAPSTLPGVPNVPGYTP
jgi:cell division protein FtsB